MNRTKKYAIILLSIAMLTTVLAGGTWAYFTDTDVNENIVTMGHVQIKLEEPEFEKQTKHSFRMDDVMPTQVIIKDPTVTVNAASEACYLRAKIVISGFELLPQDSQKTKEDYCRELERQLKVKSGDRYVSMEEFGWIKSGEYYYYFGGAEEGICRPKDIIPIFSQVTIPRSWDMEVASQEFRITISAEAVQAENFKPTRNGDRVEWLITQDDRTIVEATPEVYYP